MIPSCRYLTACVLGVVLCGALVNVKSPNYLGLIVGIPVGLVLFVGSFGAAFFARQDKQQSFTHFFSDIAWCGTEKLRATINENARVVPLVWIWDLMVKYAIPPILLGLIVVAIIGDVEAGGYEGYPKWLQGVSTLLLLAILAAFIRKCQNACFELFQSSFGNAKCMIHLRLPGNVCPSLMSLCCTVLHSQHLHPSLVGGCGG